MKIAILIPTTSNKTTWKSMENTTLYNIFLPSFIKTADKEHNYTVYLGYDYDDKLFSNIAEQNKINPLLTKNISVKFIKNNFSKGHVTKIWNQLFEIAYHEENEYFYQTGDDITFERYGWMNRSIQKLKENNNIGIAGTHGNNCRFKINPDISV